MNANFHTGEQSEAAKALALTDLAEGTAVSWHEDKGWGRGFRRRNGRITKVTPKSYLVESWLGGTARIGREDPEGRGLRALATPEEVTQRMADNTVAREQAARDAEQRKAQERVAEQQREANRRATTILIQRHQAEFDTLVAGVAESLGMSDAG